LAVALLSIPSFSAAQTPPDNARLDLSSVLGPETIVKKIDGSACFFTAEQSPAIPADFFKIKTDIENLNKIVESLAGFHPPKRLDLNFIVPEIAIFKREIKSITESIKQFEQAWQAHKVATLDSLKKKSTALSKALDVAETRRQELQASLPPEVNDPKVLETRVMKYKDTIEQLKKTALEAFNKSIADEKLPIEKLTQTDGIFEYRHYTSGPLTASKKQCDNGDALEGSEIALYNKPGDGTCFHIKIPHDSLKTSAAIKTYIRLFKQYEPLQKRLGTTSDTIEEGKRSLYAELNQIKKEHEKVKDIASLNEKINNIRNSIESTQQNINTIDSVSRKEYFIKEQMAEFPMDRHIDTVRTGIKNYIISARKQITDRAFSNTTLSAESFLIPQNASSVFINVSIHSKNSVMGKEYGEMQIHHGYSFLKLQRNNSAVGSWLFDLNRMVRMKKKNADTAFLEFLNTSPFDTILTQNPNPITPSRNPNKLETPRNFVAKITKQLESILKKNDSAISSGTVHKVTCLEKPTDGQYNCKAELEFEFDESLVHSTPGQNSSQDVSVSTRKTEPQSKNEANRLYVEASELLRRARQKAGNYSEACELFRFAADNINTILTKYQYSNIAVSIISGQTLIAGLPREKFDETFKTLQQFSKAENDPRAVAKIIAKDINRELLNIDNAAHKIEMISTFAKKYVELGLKEEARYLQERLAVFASMEDSLSKNKLFAWIAVSYAEIGEVGQALKIMKDLRDINKVGVMITLAKSYNRAGQHKKACTSLAQALNIAQIIERTPEKSRALTEIGKMYIKIKEPEQAKQALSQALDFIKTQPNDRETQWVASDTIKVFLQLDQFDKATELVNAMEDNQYIADFRLAIATQYASDGNLIKAKEELDKAIAAALEIQFKAQRTITLTKIARGYFLSGDKDRAKNILTKVSTGINEIEQSEEDYIKIRTVKLLSDEAKSYFDAGLEKQGENLLSLMYEFTNTIDNPSKKAIGLCFITKVYDQVGKNALATKIFAQALFVSQQIEDQQNAYELLSAVRAFKKAGQRDRAGKLLDRTSELAKSIEDKKERSRLLTWVADEYSNIGQVTQAIELVKENGDMTVIYKHLLQAAAYYIEPMHQPDPKELAEFTRILHKTHPVEEFWQ